MYTDNTLLTSGKYPFVRLGRVPARYLLKIYKANNQQDKQLHEYIATHLEELKARKDRLVEAPLPTLRCNKQSFFSEKVAKEALHLIMNREQDRKKPVRTYECARCGGWHLTSIPFEKWDKDLKPAGVLKLLQHNASGNGSDTTSTESTNDNPGKRRTLKLHPGKDPETKKPCNKFTYQNEREARYAVHKTEKRVVGFKNPVRAFRCEKCGGWHLTSIPYERWEVHHKRGGMYDFIHFHQPGRQFRFG